jgi:hypothetical protein
LDSVEEGNMPSGELFLAGAAGAIAPEIVRLYEMRADPKIRFSSFYFLISIAYVVLGGYVASIFPGIEKPFFASCVGAGLVLVVNKMVYIGGLLADRVTQLVGGPPRPEPTSGFGRREAENERPRPGGLLDFTRKL